MVNEQVTAFIPHLKEGSSYLFEHTRKGPFVGVFRGTEPTKEGDPQDTIWLRVDAYTEEGSGQERLANSFVRDGLGRKVRPQYSSKLIRPSLLRSISTPSATDQKEMAQRFEEQREVSAPLSMPTEIALRQVGGKSTSTSLAKKLWHWPRKVN